MEITAWGLDASCGPTVSGSGRVKPSESAPITIAGSCPLLAADSWPASHPSCVESIALAFEKSSTMTSTGPDAPLEVNE